MSELWKCTQCGYLSNKRKNYNRHLKTHLKKNNLDIPSIIGQNSNEEVDNQDGYILPHDRHILPETGNDVATSNINIPKIRTCPYCSKEFTNNSSFSRHFHHRCPKRKEAKLQNQTLEQPKQVSEENNPLANKLLEIINSLVKEIKELRQSNIGTQYNNSHNNNSVNTAVQNNFSNCKMITINYLNQNYPNVIPIEKFKTNLQTNYQLTKEQAQRLVGSRNMGFNQFADEFIRVLNDNHQNQITFMPTSKIEDKEDTNTNNQEEDNNQDNQNNNQEDNQEDIQEEPETIKYDDIFPILITDSNLRTHNEKTKGGWSKTASLDNIKDIFNICNDQIFYHTKELIYLTDRQRINLYNRIRRSHFFQPQFPYQETEDELKFKQKEQEDVIRIKEKRYQELIKQYTQEHGKFIPLPLD